MSETDQWADAAAVVRLERALSWRIAGGCPARPLAWALLCQALATWALWSDISTARGDRTTGRRPPTATRVFTPPSEAAVRTAQRAALLAPGMTAAPERHGDFPNTVPDLSAIELRFADDVGGKLPDVVQRQNGMLALLDKDDPTIARYLFRPPDWEARKDVVDVSSMLCLWMDPPERWAVFRGLASRYGISLGGYRAGALFDISYRRCLQEAIAREAEIERPGSPARVVTARLAFAADQPCGIRVLEVSLGKNL